VGLAGIQPDRLLIFADSRQRIPHLLVNLAQQAMQAGIVFLGQQFLCMLARLGKIAVCLVGKGQVVLVATIRRIELIGRLQQRNRFKISAGLQIERTQLMVRGKTPGRGRQRGAQPAFHFDRLFRGLGSGRAIRLEGERFTGQVFAGTQSGIGAVAAGCGPVRDPGNREMRLIGKLEGRGGIVPRRRRSLLCQCRRDR